jgi:hypothetical protein
LEEKELAAAYPLVLYSLSRGLSYNCYCKVLAARFIIKLFNNCVKCRLAL